FLLISRYGLAEPGMIKQLPFGLAMMAKGKLPLSIDRMENTRELEAIFKLGGEPKKENNEIKEKEPGSAKTEENKATEAETKK
ncbi:MAG: hypothetical protein QSU88_00580, partial [Candidatus Methanoperedens sp.]|nr:hypothetical protein [Candidatus Methanoperedens sp.]